MPAIAAVSGTYVYPRERTTPLERFPEWSAYLRPADAERLHEMCKSTEYKCAEISTEKGLLLAASFVDASERRGFRWWWLARPEEAKISQLQLTTKSAATNSAVSSIADFRWLLGLMALVLIAVAFCMLNYFTLIESRRQQQLHAAEISSQRVLLEGIKRDVASELLELDTQGKAIATVTEKFVAFEKLFSGIDKRINEFEAAFQLHLKSVSPGPPADRQKSIPSPPPIPSQSEESQRRRLPER